MTNVTSYPLEDAFETFLTQELDSSSLLMYVNDVGDFTFPASTTTYVVVNPGKSNQEGMEISAKDGTAKTFTIDNRNITQGNGKTTTAQSHGVGSKVIITDNYQFWRDIVDSVATKMDIAGGTFTGDVDFSGASTTFRIPNLTEAERDALTPLDGMLVYNTTSGEYQYYDGGAWQSVGMASVPNASTTVAGIVEEATAAEVGAGTATGGTGARLFINAGSVSKTSGFTENQLVALNSDGEFDASVIPAQGAIDIELNETLTAADLVKIINDGGTAKIEALETFSIGTETEFNATTIVNPKACMLDDDKIAIGYLEGSDPKVIAATISGTTLTFGTEVDLGAAGSTGLSLAQLGTDKFVAVWRDTGAGDGTAAVCTVSGTTITNGTAVDFDTAGDPTNFGVAKLDTDKFVVVWQQETSNDGHARAATVSGTTISFGTEATLSSGTTNMTLDQTVAQLGTDRFLAVWEESSFVYTSVCTVSGTTITVGDALPLGEAVVTEAGCAELDVNSGLALIMFDEGQGIRAMVADGNGPTVSVWGETLISGGGITNGTSFKGISSDKFALVTTDSEQLLIGVIRDGQIVMYKSEQVESSDSIGAFGVTKAHSNGKLVVCADNNTATNGEAWAAIPPDFEKVGGILQVSGVATDTRSVIPVGGQSTVHSFAAADVGKKVYIQDDGTIGTDVTAFEIGRIISTTTMVIKT